MALTRILLTSFEPFAGRTINASQNLLNLARKEELSHFFKISIEHRCLEVSWQHCPTQTRSFLDAIRPNFVIAFGEANLANFHLESQAKNVAKGRILDNQGLSPEEVQIAEGAPENLKTQWDLESLGKAFNDHKIPAEISEDAGAFLCNFLYYHLLNCERSEGFESMFIHVPIDWQLSSSSMESLSDRATEILKIIIQQALATVKN